MNFAPDKKEKGKEHAIRGGSRGKGGRGNGRGGFGRRGGGSGTGFGTIRRGHGCIVTVGNVDRGGIGRGGHGGGHAREQLGKQSQCIQFLLIY